MERKHKYKAWDKINNKWLNDEFIISTQSKGVIEFCGVSTDNDAALINEDVIFLEFTGLHDKNGKEIYEGDIIKHPLATDPEDCGWIVKWVNFGFISELANPFIDESTGKQLVTDFSEYFTDCEVIGNIYENPELIK